MKKTKIFYVFGYGDTPESTIVQELQKRLDKDKYEVISDYYAQYKPEEAIYDFNNYIKKNKIDLLIGENIGGYLITLLDNDLPKVLIDPIYNPVIELAEYEETTKNDKGEEITLKLVPPHIIEFYNKSKLKPKYDDNICVMLSDEKNNYKEYSKVVKNCYVYKDPIGTLIDKLNNLKEEED